MKDLEDLSKLDKEILNAFCKANDYTLKAHSPLGMIRKKLKPKYHQYFKSIIKHLRSKGFIQKRPGSKAISYRLTPKGLNI